MQQKIHTHEFNDIIIPPTCTEQGYTLHKCNCGYEYKDNFKPQGHNWSEWIVEKYPTCVEDGKRVRICHNCDSVEEEIIKATGHKLSSPQKSADAKGVFYFCENCGQSIKKPSVITKVENYIITHKKCFIISLISVLVVCSILVSIFTYFIPLSHYNRAKEEISNKNYTEAYTYLMKSNGFKDSNELLLDFVPQYKERTFKTTKYFNGEKTIEESKCIYAYDEHGNIISGTRYDMSGNEEDSWGNEYVYSDDGKLIAENNYYSEIREEHKYSYDENGNITKDEYDFCGEKGTYLYKYDERNNLISKHSYDYYETTYKEEEYSYDENGNMVLELHYNDDGVLTYKIKYQYDSKGNKIQAIHTDGDGENEKIFKYRYDEYNNEISEIWYNSEGNIIQKKEYGYNKLTVYYNPKNQ